MTDLRIIPAEPYAESRERYRDLATQDRPGDPWTVEFDARDAHEPFPARVLVWGAAVCLGLVAILIGGIVG